MSPEDRIDAFFKEFERIDENSSDWEWELLLPITDTVDMTVTAFRGPAYTVTHGWKAFDVGSAYIVGDEHEISVRVRRELNIADMGHVNTKPLAMLAVGIASMIAGIHDNVRDRIRLQQVCDMQLGDGLVCEVQSCHMPVSMWSQLKLVLAQYGIKLTFWDMYKCKQSCIVMKNTRHEVALQHMNFINHGVGEVSGYVCIEWDANVGRVRFVSSTIWWVTECVGKKRSVRVRGRAWSYMLAKLLAAEHGSRRDFVELLSRFIMIESVTELGRTPGPKPYNVAQLALKVRTVAFG